MEIKCRGEGCSHKNKCKRYLCKDNNIQTWFASSPLYSDGTCRFFAQASEEEIYQYKVVIFNSDRAYKIGVLDHILGGKYYDEYGGAWNRIIPFESVEQYLYLIDNEGN
ncbi:MAG: hypothetical protein PHT02_14670 [Tissierellia bacterium]|nr:hypothetical protein [Tissierellia bacterium]